MPYHPQTSKIHRHGGGVAMSAMTALTILLLAILESASHVAGAAASAVVVEPKMIQEPYTEGKTLGPPSSEVRLKSHSATYVGECTPTTPFGFVVDGITGRGAIGVEAPGNDKGIEIRLIDINLGHIDITGESEPNFFAMDSIPSEDFVAFPFLYQLETEPTAADDNNGTKVEVSCTTETSIVVFVNDEGGYEVEAVVKEYYDGDEIELVGNTPEAAEPLQGRTRRRKGSTEQDSPVEFDPSSKRKIKIRRRQNRQDRGVALIDGVFTTPEGKKVHRTFVRESRARSAEFQTPREINVKCCDINDDGDVEIRFPGLARSGQSFRVDARLGIDLPGGQQQEAQQQRRQDVVDATAMIGHNGVMTVHGGWIRDVLGEMNDVGDEDFDISLADVVVTDPNDSFRVVGRMGKDVVRNGIHKKQTTKRKKLNRKASTKEKNRTDDDMKIGRKKRVAAAGIDNENQKRGLRRLTGTHKKILVHGYCASGNPFTTSHFTDAIVFDVGANGDNNWSHDQFALKIATFASDNGITGCGCIAHSQGGAACLHLYNYYWSCLDYATEGGDRLIQTVGTPYQGSPLAGNLAAIGELFGAGCGENEDLTTSGAVSWLSGIGSTARAAVTYYTTTFEDVWWRYDYCHLVTDLILSDDEDGATEEDRGQLPGGNNGGHVDNQCHSDGMRDPAQCRNPTRNAEMNTNAKY